MAAKLPRPQIPITDVKTGAPTREWYRYELDQFEQAGGDSGVTPVTSGGTGLAAGTSGGVLYFNSSTTIQSSDALTSNQIVFGGGAGNPPSTPLAGTLAKRILLSGGVGVLPQWSGYVMPTNAFQGDLLYASVNDVMQRLPKSTTSTHSLTNTGTNNNPKWALVNLTTGVEGELLVNNVLQVQVYSW